MSKSIAQLLDATKAAVVRQIQSVCLVVCLRIFLRGPEPGHQTVFPAFQMFKAVSAIGLLIFAKVGNE